MKKITVPSQPAVRDVLTSTLPTLLLPMVRPAPTRLSVEIVANPMLQTLLVVNSGSIVLIGHGSWPVTREKAALEAHPSSVHILSPGKPVLAASLQLLRVATVVARRR